MLIFDERCSLTMSQIAPLEGAISEVFLFILILNWHQICIYNLQLSIIKKGSHYIHEIQCRFAAFLV